MLNHIDGVFLIALRLMLRLQPEAAAMEITFALIGGIICARQVRSEKVRQAMLRWPPLAAIGAEILAKHENCFAAHALSIAFATSAFSISVTLATESL